jgi:ABC-type metal ion transport system substrate-binding protein
MSFQHNHGFELKNRRPRRLALGAGALALVLLSGALVAARLGGDATARPLGTTLRVGYNQGSIPQSALVKYVAAHTDDAYGIKVVPVPVNDANQVNGSTEDGALAANITQHAEWLKVIVANEGYRVRAVEPLFTQKFAVYSLQHDSLRALPDGATIALPNDPANQAQALLTLQRLGLIKLNKDIDPLTAQVDDIASNPHRFRWHQLALDAISRSLPDVDAAINYAYKFRVAKIPTSRLIASPKADKRYAIQLVVADDHAGDPGITKLRRAFANPRVDRFITHHLDKETRPAPHTFPKKGQPR